MHGVGGTDNVGQTRRRVSEGYDGFGRRERRASRQDRRGAAVDAQDRTGYGLRQSQVDDGIDHLGCCGRVDLVEPRHDTTAVVAAVVGAVGLLPRGAALGWSGGAVGRGRAAAARALAP